jgi:hypothetical protein
MGSATIGRKRSVDVYYGQYKGERNKKDKNAESGDINK